MRDTRLPTDPPPMGTLTAVKYEVTPKEGQPGMPHGRVYLPCRRPGCLIEYDLSLDRPFGAISEDAKAAGWDWHPSLGPVCPEHPYGTPMGELEATAEDLHKSRQSALETQEIPASVVAAAMADPEATVVDPPETDPTETVPDGVETPEVEETAEEAKS